MIGSSRLAPGVRDMSKKFDATGPHDHTCFNCWATIYCCGADCEIPQYAECLPCQRWSSGVEHFDYDNHPFKNASGYRKTWPGRFAVEHYTLPYGAARIRRRQC